MELLRGGSSRSGRQKRWVKWKLEWRDKGAWEHRKVQKRGVKLPKHLIQQILFLPTIRC